ncbi:hypothetical protein PI95_016335 [Hassallia byssoidea VB512170]|uniref:Uncharacterized protein n=1 Tax=Hassallia byssoidea VB512170 TaxID=1304833 RepID=A0A846H9N7_9CYAN|nr:hypothetical protein [Hassalia byssoidea]NEU74082.1 hypothetical protein [Hassalia byssoidea VB512170]
MFTRSQLEIKTLNELGDLCRKYGIKPTGNPGYKISYITSLMTFPELAIKQITEARGLKRPSWNKFEAIGECLDEMGTPTDEQSALIKMTMEGRRMAYPSGFDQEMLLSIYKAKLHLEQAIDMLNL